jgi:hypothetical protein
MCLVGMILMAKPKYLMINVPHEPYTDWPGLGSKLTISGESDV